MKKTIIRVAASLGVLFMSCGNAEKMLSTADQVKITCDPQVLVSVGGVVKAKITVTFPDKYFDASAILEVQPVVKYKGQELTLEATTLQGEKVKANNKVIRATGGEYTQDISFEYKEGMSIASLELRPTLVLKDKRLPFPKDFKAADGIVANYLLAEPVCVPATIDPIVQLSTPANKQAEIKFLINQSNIRPTELKKEDLKELKDLLVSLSKDAHARIQSVQVSSYASPDGPTNKNEALSAGRGKATSADINSYLKKSKLKPLSNDIFSVLHTAEDWDGFKKLMESSNIQDKDLVLRVLAMYSDPAEREKEIKNISKIYEEIAETILPQLRRSSITVQAEVFGLFDEEIKAFVEAKQLDKLTADQILYAVDKFYADSIEAQKTLYQYVGESLQNAAAYNNLAVIYLNENNVAEAQKYLNSAAQIDAQDKSVSNNQGYVALLNGDKSGAEKLLSSTGLPASKEGLAYLAIFKGNYGNAATQLRGTNSVNEGLVHLLQGNLDKASQILATIETAKAYYIKAIIAARQNKAEDVKTNLDKAAAQDATWKEKAKTNIEFANFPVQ
ncbi:hypothetical protein AGMMS4956_12520 [Bacteroidia bacterium]|nr:hypothetical protein AGMMS4956_12520 [Bacteroidia bacterium]